MTDEQVTSLLYTIYAAGFNHGSNEGFFPEHGIYDAFNRLIAGESPLKDNVKYGIKEKVDELLSKFEHVIETDFN